MKRSSSLGFAARGCALKGAPSEVWQMAVTVSEAFEQIRAQAIAWYNDRGIFTFAFPSDEADENRDNCATFPRRLGIPLPEPTVNLRDYLPALQANHEGTQTDGDPSIQMASATARPHSSRVAA